MHFFRFWIVVVLSVCCAEIAPAEDGGFRQVPYSASIDEEKTWVGVRKVRRPPSVFRAMLECGLVDLRANFWRSLVLGYLVPCTPAGCCAASFAVVFFVLSSIRLCFPFCKYFFGREWLDDVAEEYGLTLWLLFRAAVLGAAFLAGWQLLLWAASLVRDAAGMAESLRSAMFGRECRMGFLAACVPNVDWTEKLRGRGFRIEESGDWIRVTVGELRWEFFAENEFDRKVFSVLLATARGEEGGTVVTSRPLAAALGWSHHDLLNRCVRAWEHAGNTFVGLVDRTNNVYQGRLLAKIREILRQDFTLTLVEIRDRLEAQGWACQVGVEQMRQALRKADFNELHEDIRRYCAGRTEEGGGTAFDGDNREAGLKIERIGSGWRVVLGDLFWDVDESNRFGLASLLHILLGAFTREGRRITGVRTLARMLEWPNYQDLQKLLKKYRRIAGRFGRLEAVYGAVEAEKSDNRLRGIILDMWLEDITLPVVEIEKRLGQMPNLPGIGRNRIRGLMRQIDFWPLRARLARDCRKGEYRKSTVWTIGRYREIVEHLLSQLAAGKTWSRAEIDEYSERMPSAVHPGAPKERTRFVEPIGKVWLKCFLFDLPKMRDGKVCCPKCGSFDTARKSNRPEMRTVTEQGGQSRQVNVLRFHCRNPHCPAHTFSAPVDGSHVLEQARFAKACLMLRQVITMRSPYRALADLLGTSKSIIFGELTHVSEMADHWQEILGPARFSGTVCIDEKFVRIAAFKKTRKRPFGYLFFAVDPATGDLLHVEIFASRDKQSAEAFLMQLKAKGIHPRTIMTDLVETYDQPVRSVYGRSVTMARCFFHFKKNIFEHMHRQFDKKEIPEIATRLKEDIFDVVDAKARKTIRERYQALQRKKTEYLGQEPRLLPMFACLESYYPHLMRMTENCRVSIRTNNPAELVIRHFNQRYKVMGGFKSLETARRHARLFQIVYRFTPLGDDVEIASRRGRTPLELAGYEIRNMPIYRYLTAPLLFNIEPEKNLALIESGVA